MPIDFLKKSFILRLIVKVELVKEGAFGWFAIKCGLGREDIQIKRMRNLKKMNGF